MTTSVVIERRFRGPPTSGNGGYVAGLLADYMEGTAEITLRSPPPLETPLHIASTSEGVAMHAGEQLVAEGKWAEFDLQLPTPPSFEEAERAAKGYPGFSDHLYPECFVCGPARGEHDGLRLFPGAVEQRKVAAAPFEPQPDLCDGEGHLRARFVWASLDCPSWWGHVAFAKQTAPVLLGRLTATIRSRPRAGESCVVMGWSLGQEGRRILCASALIGEQGRAHAYARATWVELKK